MIHIDSGKLLLEAPFIEWLNKNVWLIVMDTIQEVIAEREISLQDGDVRKKIFIKVGKPVRIDGSTDFYCYFRHN